MKRNGPAETRHKQSYTRRNGTSNSIIQIVADIDLQLSEIVKYSRVAAILMLIVKSSISCLKDAEYPIRGSLSDGPRHVSTISLPRYHTLSSPILFIFC